MTLTAIEGFIGQLSLDVYPLTLRCEPLEEKRLVDDIPSFGTVAGSDLVSLSKVSHCLNDATPSFVCPPIVPVRLNMQLAIQPVVRWMGTETIGKAAPFTA
jgi:hypothetical protein